MMHCDQVHIDADIVREMIFDQFPEYRHERIDQLGAIGTVNAIFRIGSSVAARFPLRAMAPTECANMLRNEAAAMTEFATHSPVACPRPIGLGQPGPLYPLPWALQSWIEGDVATQDGLAASTTFALDIANLIASLRAANTHGRRLIGEGRAAVFLTTTTGCRSVSRTAKVFLTCLSSVAFGLGCVGCRRPVPTL